MLFGKIFFMVEIKKKIIYLYFISSFIYNYLKKKNKIVGVQLRIKYLRHV